MISRTSAKNQIINLGSTEEISMMQLAGIIHKLVNSKDRFRYKLIPYESFTGRPYQDVRAKLPSLIKAEKLLGWRPKTTLSAGLEKTRKWYQSN